MKRLEGSCGLSADIGTSHFGFIVEPRDDDRADALRRLVGMAFGAANAKARGIHAGMKLFWVKAFGWPLATTFDNIDSETGHLVGSGRHSSRRQDGIYIDIKAQNQKGAPSGELHKALIVLAPFLDTA